MGDNSLLIQYMVNKALMQRLMTRKEIFYVQMNVTNHCSDNCWHCYLKGKHNIPDEAGISDFVEILKQVREWAEKHSKRLVVDLIGGDPLSKPHIDKLLEYLAQEKINDGIKGNPYLLGKYIDRLVSMRCKRYQMSLDGLEETHDMIRSKNSFQATLSAIKLLNEHQMPVTIKYTLSAKNSGQLWPLLYNLYEHDIRISSFLVARYHDQRGESFHVSKTYYDETFKHLTEFYNMQIENKDVKIYINLKEHLWIPYLSKKKYLFKDYYELLEKNPFLSSCSMISSNSTIITSDGYYDVCPKISGFGKIKNIYEYMKKKEIYLEEVKNRACLGCEVRKLCLGCLAFHTDSDIRKDCDCFYYHK